MMAALFLHPLQLSHCSVRYVSLHGMQMMAALFLHPLQLSHCCMRHVYLHGMQMMVALFLHPLEFSCRTSCSRCEHEQRLHYKSHGGCSSVQFEYNTAVALIFVLKHTPYGLTSSRGGHTWVSVHERQC